MSSRRLPESAPSLSNEEFVAQTRAQISRDDVAPQPEPTSSGLVYEPGWWSTHNAMTMCASVLVFGMIVIAISSYLALRRLDKGTILNVVVIPMTVMSAVFLLVAGYDDKQVASTMGLLGTIVGYILGSRSRESQPKAGGETRGGKADESKKEEKAEKA